jgi:transposase
MQLHLDEIAKDVAPGRHAVLLLDQAGWHMSSKLDVPGNLTLVPLPAKCPELNPAENVWEFMRDNWLSNRVFHNADDLIDHCCEAWNKLRSQPWRLMSIGMRESAHKFSSTILGITPGYRRIATCWVMLLFSVKTCQLSAPGAGVMNGDTHRARRRRYRRSRPSPTRHRVCRPPDSYRRKPKRLARICRLEAI